jgi:hypothetical protein
MEPQLEGIQQPQLLPSTGTDPNEHIAQAMSSRELQEVFDYDAIPQEALQRALSQNDQVAAIQTSSAPLTDSTTNSYYLSLLEQVNLLEERTK